MARRDILEEIQLRALVTTGILLVVVTVGFSTYLTQNFDSDHAS
jgi:hypothetical protein